MPDMSPSLAALYVKAQKDGTARKHRYPTLEDFVLALCDDTWACILMKRHGVTPSEWQSNAKKSLVSQQINEIVASEFALRRVLHRSEMYAKSKNVLEISLEVTILFVKAELKYVATLNSHLNPPNLEQVINEATAEDVQPVVKEEQRPKHQGLFSRLFGPQT